MSTDSSPRPSRLQEISFHGDKILIALHPDGQVGIAPRTICENLDIVWRYQYEKFRRDPIWGMKSYIRSGDDPDTKLYLIPFQRLGGWLYTIHTSKLLDRPKEKLRLYKEGLVAAIEDFLRQQNVPPAPQEPASEPVRGAAEKVDDSPSQPDAETAPEPPSDVSPEAPGVPGTFPEDVAGGPHVSPFDPIRHEDERGDYWFAREMVSPMGFQRWENFLPTIERAMISCRAAGLKVEDNFLAIHENSSVDGGGGRPRLNYRLTRYGCYLIAMNGDPCLPEIASAQQYFVVRTHQAETSERDGISNRDLMAALIRSQDRHDQILSVLSNGHVEMKQVVSQTQEDVAQVKREAEEAKRAAQEAQAKTEEAWQAAIDAQEEAAKAQIAMEEQAARIVELEKVAPPQGYATIAGFMRHKGVSREMSEYDFRMWGIRMTAVCRSRKIEFHLVPDSRWTTVNSYPIDLLEEKFELWGPHLRWAPSSP